LELSLLVLNTTFSHFFVEDILFKLIGHGNRLVKMYEPCLLHTTFPAFADSHIAIQNRENQYHETEVILKISLH